MKQLAAVCLLSATLGCGEGGQVQPKTADPLQERAEQPETVDALRKRAEQGEAGAQYLLGERHFNGQGVPEDEAEAVRLFRLAADQQMAEAQFNLGFMYDTGEGVPQDHVEAHMWFNLAASRSTGEQRDESVNNRDRPAGQLTPDGLNEAQRLASPDAPIPVLTGHIPTAMPCPRRRLPFSRTNQCASG